MALKNFTEDDSKTVEELSCSAEFFRGVDCELIFISALNIFSFHYCISGENSDPSCPTEGNFTSSAVQTPIS